MTFPTLQTIWLFALAAGVLIAIPGPNHLYIATLSASQGRAAGIAASVGVELGTLVHVALAAAGLSYLVAASATAFTVVKYAGAAYLFYLAWKAWRAKPSPDEPRVVARHSLARVLGQGMLINLLNPKVILFFVAFVPQFLDPGRGAIWSQVVVLGLVLVTLGVVSNLVYAFGASAIAGRLAGRERRGFAGAGRWAQVVVYALLGVLALLTSPGRTASAR